MSTRNKDIFKDLHGKELNSDTCLVCITLLPRNFRKRRF